jgi:imidazolonepropionase-like amidohydrolase
VTTVINVSAVIDGTGAEPTSAAQVVIEGERIVAVGPRAAGSAPPGAQVISHDGATLVPGLIDCHVHLAGLHTGGWNAGESPESVAENTADVISGLADVLRGGITTVRDCGYPHHGIFAVRKAQQDRRVLGPRLLLSGRALRASGGHGQSISVTADGADEFRRAARLELKAGAEWVKLMITGGTASPNEQVSDVQVTLDEATAAVRETHSRGRQVSAHCSNLAGTHLALDAEVDSIEHGIELDDEAIEKMLARQAWLVPSLLCTRVEAESGPDSGIAKYIRQKAAEIYRRQEASFRRALAAGVRIAAATDAGPSYLPVGSPSLAGELSTMIGLGMDPVAAIAAATGQAAKLLRIDGEVGTIAPGRIADLVVLPGDPRADIRVLKRPIAVFQAGQSIGH